MCGWRRHYKPSIQCRVTVPVWQRWLPITSQITMCYGKRTQPETLSNAFSLQRHDNSLRYQLGNEHFHRPCRLPVHWPRRPRARLALGKSVFWRILRQLPDTTVSEVSASGATLILVVYPQTLATITSAPALWPMLFFIMIVTLGVDSQVH